MATRLPNANIGNGLDGWSPVDNPPKDPRALTQWETLDSDDPRFPPGHAGKRGRRLDGTPAKRNSLRQRPVSTLLETLRRVVVWI